MGPREQRNNISVAETQHPLKQQLVQDSRTRSGELSKDLIQHWADEWALQRKKQKQIQ